MLLPDPSQVKQQYIAFRRKVTSVHSPPRLFTSVRFSQSSNNFGIENSTIMADSSNVSKRTRPGTRLRRRCARKRLREALEHSDISEEMEVNTPNAPLGSDLGSSSWPSSSGSQSSSSQSSGGIPLVHRIIAEEAWSQWGSKISSPKITDCEFVASYNWLQEDKPSIIVPGQYTSPEFC